MTDTPAFPEPSSTENIDTSIHSGIPSGGGVATATIPPGPPPPHPPPVPEPARRGSGWTIFFVIMASALGALLLAVVGLFALVAVVVGGVAAGEIDINLDAVEVNVTPTTLDELPASIIEENGDIRIDLTQLDAGDFANVDTPVALDVRADAGSVTVIVPEDIDVSVDAEVDLGDLTVFGNSDDGFSNSIVQLDDGAHIALDVDLDVGQVEVVKG